MPSPTDLARKELRGSGFTNPYAKRGPALFAAVFGVQKTGKTFFCKDAPGPIAYMGIDDGHRGVMDEDAESGHALVSTYPYPTSKNMQADAGKTWAKIQSDFDAALGAKHIRTVVWDTGTEIYETLVLSRNGRVSEIPGLERGKIKRILGTMMRDALNSDKNFIWIAKEADVWKANKPTGAVKAAGFSELGYYAEVIVHLTKKRQNKKQIHTGEIIDCRFSRELEGEELDSPTFLDVACLVRPDVGDEHWSCSC